jgi:hypothetical protein
MKPMQPMNPMRPSSPIQRWWPQGLGDPETSGSQDGMRYAVFPDKQLLLIEEDGKLKTFDSGRHRIHGVSQVNSKTRSLTFTSQHEPVRVEDLKRLN